MPINGAYNGNMNYANSEIPPPPPHMRGLSNESIGSQSPSTLRHKSALAIAFPGSVRERTLSDVNSLAFQVIYPTHYFSLTNDVLVF